MRARIAFLTLLFIGGALLLPVVTHANTIPYFGPIIEESWAENSDVCPLGWGAVILTINNIIVIAISIAIVFVAPLMLAWSGFLLVANPFNPGAKEQAKKMLTNTIVGIVIALSGWMIVAAVMAVFYNPTDARLAGENWANLITGEGLKCIPLASSLDPVLYEERNGPAGPVDPTAPVAVIPPTAPPEEAAVRAQLSAAGISVNKAPCNPYNVRGSCTNVGGMLSTTVSQVINIKNACGGCTIIVTGGSEAGHAAGTYSHGNGYKVDFGLNATLNNFLIGKLTKSGERGGDHGGAIYKDSCGNEYVKESNHWDIKVLRSCSL